MSWPLARFALLAFLALAIFGCNSRRENPAQSNPAQPSPRAPSETAAPTRVKTVTIMIPARARDRGQETLRAEDIPSPSAPMIPAHRDPTSGIDPNID